MNRKSCVGSLTGMQYGVFFFFVFFFLNSVLRPFQDYFSSYETGQSDTPASRTWLVSHVVRAELEPTPDTAVR